MSRSPSLPASPALNGTTRNIVISGTNFWNPGDDFVRDGVIRVLKSMYPADALNFLFYNFNADFFPQDKFAGISNLAARGDLDRYRDKIDAIVIAGLSAGDEIQDLYRWIIANGLEKRVCLIGAGYENDYVDQHVAQEPEATIFRNARIIIGRTAKVPGFIRTLGTPYRHVNCPAILSVPHVKETAAGRRIERIGFSIQLPHDEGLVNHSCARPQYELALDVLEDLSRKFCVEIIAHHKSEYFHFLNLERTRGIPVRFSSFYQDLFEVYPRFDLVVTTRLHSSLFANGHGVPGIIINDTDRHTHTLDGFPHSTWVNTREGFDREFDRVCQLDLRRLSEESSEFKQRLLAQYAAVLAEPLGALGQADASPAGPSSGADYQFDSERKEQLLVRRLVKPGMTVLDVGANIGKYTKLLSLLVGGTGRVFAFEPAPSSFQRIQTQVAVEKLANVVPINQAVCDCQGPITLHQFPEEYSSWNSLGRPRMEDPRDPSRLVPIVSEIQVEASTLDGFCRERGLDGIDYLKLDVEGAELRALKGARQLLERKAIRYLQFEISQKMLEGLNTQAGLVFDFLAEHGYDCHAITEDGEIGARAVDSSAFYENYIAFPAKQAAVAERGPKSLPVHFFTIVLNGQPFIRYHIEVLRQLPFRWHWHVVEGVADLTHDTAWSKALGGRITTGIQRNGLSNDGTTEYLDALSKQFPDQVTIYRKPANEIWDGKLEMVNAPLKGIREECLLWQIDADELWTAEQLRFGHQLFLARPDKTAAFFLCHYFVGKELVITTRDTYGNHTDYEWIRAWRYKPGCRWMAHEPPRLCQPDARGQLADLATLNPFRHNETEALDLVFQHYAYATEAQLRFKETYYGYTGAVEQWRGLQAQRKFPVQLAGHFAWVKDKAQVNTVASEGIIPIARPNESGEWTFTIARSNAPSVPAPFETAPPRLAFSDRSAVAATGTLAGLAARCGGGETGAAASPISNADPKRVLFVRTDSIGDAVLAASMLPHLRKKYPDAQLAVLCQQHLSELYLACPFVDVVVSFEKQRAIQDEPYRNSIIEELAQLQPDLILNATYSSEAVTELLVHTNRGPQLVGMDGDLSNISAEDRRAASSLYSRLLPSPGSDKTELERHRDFLRGLDITPDVLAPQIWTTPADEARADALFQEHQLEGGQTIALFPGAQHECKVYPQYAAALREIDGSKFLILGGPEFSAMGDQLAGELPGRCVNLAGKTSLREMAALLRKCRLYVGADSAGAHIACAVGLPNVVVLGGGHFGRFFPYSPLTSVAALPLECFGCNWACRHAKPHCVKDLAPEVLTRAIRETMSAAALKPRIFLQQGKRWRSSPEQPQLLPAESAGTREQCLVIPVVVDGAAAPAPATAGNVVPGEEFLVSVLVSTYNSERYLRGCLEDLLAQTIAAKLEIIVIDSGSQQNERAIVEEFQKRHPHIVYLRTERETLYAAWNRGVHKARGRFITNANSDDAHRPDALELLAAALERHPEASLAYGDYFTSTLPNDTFSDPHILRRVEHPPYHPATLLFYCVIGCHPMWRRNVFDRIGLFDPSFTAPGDYEFLLRFAKAGLRAVRVPQELSLFYQNPDGLSFKAQSKSQQEFNRIQANYRGSMPIERLFKVDPRDPETVARGWVALGNMAMRYQAPWFDNISQEIDYATTCYRRALEQVPRHTAALHNLVVARMLSGATGEVESLLQQLPGENRAAFRALLQRGGELELMKVELPPAVEPLEFPASPRVAVASQGACRDAVRAHHTSLPVRWVAPLYTSGEYSGDALNLVLPLAREVRVGITDQSEHYSASVASTFSSSTRNALQVAFGTFPFITGGVAISHRPASHFNRVRGAAYHIGRTMFESEGLPPEWGRVCNQMDEIWVPSRFHARTFAQGGVEADKLVVIPGAVDIATFDPAKQEPHALAHRAACNFLASCEMSALSGWDVLIAAYAREFSAEDDVCLHLRAWFPEAAGARGTIEGKIRDLLQTLDLGGKTPPRISILPALWPQAKLPSLYRAVDCFVSPHRGSGFCGPLLEAMAMELPVIATRWGASGEFMDESCSLPLNGESVEVANVEPELRQHRGFRWAQPCEQHLRELMRGVQRNPQEVRPLGRKARVRVQESFSCEVVAGAMKRRLQEIEKKLFTPACPAVVARSLMVEAEFPDQKVRDLQVAWEGSFLDLGSLSHVNRELTKPMETQPGIRLTCVGRNSVPEMPAGMSDLQEMARRLRAQPHPQTQVTVRHAWPPNWQQPATGLWVLIQPWEFGVLPLEWARQLGRVDEVWVPSEYARRVYVDSGIQPGKVKVVPNGIDPVLFHPEAPPAKLGTQKRFKFLFVGGTIHRKGPDVLLRAYLDRFTAEDDVCLVIKDFGGKDVYAGQTFEAQIRAAQKTPGAPEILHLTGDLAAEEVAGLYTACDCLVHPYRGEGFGLPILEAMACGLPVIVTGGGSSDDFATDEFAMRLPALRQSLGTTVGGMDLVREGWVLEPSLEALREAMREVFQNPEPARARGRQASVHVRREWTWERAAKIAAQRLQNLRARSEAAREAVAKRRSRVAPAIELPPVARLGQLKEATEAFRAKSFESAWNLGCAAIERRPHHPEGYLLLAEIARAAGDGSNARWCAEQARRLAPKWKAAREFLKALPAKTKKDREPGFPLPKAATVSSEASRLSVCLIVRNEEKFLKRALESVRTLAHQIVVVDTGSTDSTVEIARQQGAEVYSFPWQDDFSAARNAALERATGDWVLILDADEELTPEGCASLKQELRSDSVMAYRLPIVDRGREEEGCSYVPRLFRNAPGLFFVGRIHEQVFSSVEVRRREWGLENRLGKAVLLHHGYAQQVTRQRGKNARNLALLEKAIEEMPNEPNLLMNYGLESIRAGQFEAGLEAYWEAVHRMSVLPADQVIPELCETLLTQLSSHLLGNKDFISVSRLLRSPLARAHGLTATLHFSLGLALMELKQFSEAAEQMGQCLLKRTQPALTPINKEIRGAAPRHCLAICRKHLKQPKEAAKAFAEARAEDPNSRAVCFDYARFLVEQEEPVEALKLLHQMISSEPEDADLWLLGGHIALGRLEFLEFARDWTGEAIQHLPQHPRVILQRAEALLLSGETEASLVLWRKAGSPTHPRHISARLICEIDSGRPAELPREAGNESLLSEEFLKWYRRLLEAGASRTISTLNTRLAQVRRLLPSVGRVLDQALREADQAAAS